MAPCCSSAATAASNGCVHLQDVPRFCPTHVDGPSQDVHAITCADTRRAAAAEAAAEPQHARVLPPAVIRRQCLGTCAWAKRACAWAKCKCERHGMQLLSPTQPPTLSCGATGGDAHFCPPLVDGLNTRVTLGAWVRNSTIQQLLLSWLYSILRLATMAVVRDMSGQVVQAWRTGHLWQAAEAHHGIMVQGPSKLSVIWQAVIAGSICG